MPQNNAYLSGSDVLVQVLVEKGVKKIFAITGAGNLAIIDAIRREGSIKILYAYHEQAAVMEVQGYARVTGEIGVALVTTGGGSSNVTTGILSAHLDSIPILLISGNESSFHCANPYNLRAYGVQGFNSTETLQPITKLAFRIKSVSDVVATIRDSIELALENRMGPVHIDFPMDLQRKVAVVAMARFQRASVALPPPFFFGPPNQVTRDPDVPIGQGTNTALQSKPVVLHPSIDEPSVNNKVTLLLPLEMFAPASILVVNQASWFWGWGGLWLWPIVLYLSFRYINQGIGPRFKIFSNILLLHSLLLILSAPLPRYVMATILLGVLLTINIALNSYLKIAKNFLNEQSF